MYTELGISIERLSVNQSINHCIIRQSINQSTNQPMSTFDWLVESLCDIRDATSWLSWAISCLFGKNPAQPWCGKCSIQYKEGKGCMGVAGRGVYLEGRYLFNIRDQDEVKVYKM